MSTLSATNLKNASSASNNIVLNTDGTIGGAALAATSDVTGVTTTGTVTAATTSLVVASATGITVGMYVVGEGITPGTTVSSIASTTVTLSANAGATLSSAPVTFYSASKVLSPAAVGGMLCRAWVNFNGTSSVAIRASYNVSSITDNGVGNYTMNFTTAMPDASYAVFFGLGGGLNGNSSFVGGVLTTTQNGTASNKTTSAVQFTTNDYTATLGDFGEIYVSIFR